MGYYTAKTQSHMTHPYILVLLSNMQMRSDKDIGMVSCSSVCCVMHFEPSLYPASFFDFSFFHLYNKDLVLCRKSTPPPQVV